MNIAGYGHGSKGKKHMQRCGLDKYLKDREARTGLGSRQWVASTAVDRSGWFSNVAGTLWWEQCNWKPHALAHTLRTPAI